MNQYYFGSLRGIRLHWGVATLPQPAGMLKVKLLYAEELTKRYYRLFPHMRGRTTKQWRRQRHRGETRTEWNKRRDAFAAEVFWPSYEAFLRSLAKNPPLGFYIEPEGAA